MTIDNKHLPASNRYQHMQYRQCGTSGLHLPAISLGLWQHFGHESDLSKSRSILRRAFDRGVTHFDLANNYGLPFGSAEENFGYILKRDFSGYRDELIISSKAGWGMWQGPYGNGSSRKHIIASCDQSLKRLGTDYVDIFYSHRPDFTTPLEETVDALAQLVRQGKALYIGISSYGPKRTQQAADLLKSQGVPLLIHQPSYSLLNRWIESELLETLDGLGSGTIAFSPLAQGLLTEKYLNGVPQASRAADSSDFDTTVLNEDNLSRIRALAEIAQQRGQTLAQMAIAWTLRLPSVTSALIGARNIEQLNNSLDALNNLTFTPEELSEIDLYAREGNVDLWREQVTTGE